MLTKGMGFVVALVDITTMITVLVMVHQLVIDGLVLIMLYCGLQLLWNLISEYLHCNVLLVDYLKEPLEGVT